MATVPRNLDQDTVYNCQLLRIPHSSDLGHAESVQEQPGVHEDADIVVHHRTGANCRNSWAVEQLDTAAVGMLKLA